MCRAFPTTLKGLAKVRFSKIPPSMIESFNKLRGAFVRHFIGGQRYRRPTSHLLSVRQEARESLRMYVTRFNKEVLQVDKVEDRVLHTAFQAGLRSEDFLFSITKNPLATMANLLFKAQKYMNVEDVLASKWISTRPRKEKESEDRLDHRQEGKLTHSLPKDNRGHFPKFTPLVMPPSKILIQVKNDPILRWPKTMRSNPEVRNKSMYCHFHKDHGHDTNKCHDLKNQTENLI